MLLGNIGRSHSLADAIKLNYGIRKSREDKVLRSQLVAGAWKAQVHGVNWLRGSFVIHVLQLYSLVDRFRLEGSRRGFLLSFSVSSSITRLDIILCLHLSSLLLSFTLYCWLMYEYGLG